MLKAYFLPTIQRKQRIAFLSSLRLNELRPVFAAAPRAIVDQPLTLPSGGDVPLLGYLAPRMPGPTLEAIFGDGWKPAPEVRLRLAAQLCGTVYVLEASGMAHGDIAASNAIVLDHETEAPELRVIDFDGFYYPAVPAIPCSDVAGGRGFGQSGYRHRAYAAMDDRVVVTSDRCAMAALVFEIVVLGAGDVDRLGRPTLLDQDAIDAGRPSAPADIVARWPEGWAMLESAFEAPRPEDAPSPEAWLDAVVRRSRDRRGFSPPDRGSAPPSPAAGDGWPAVVLSITEHEGAEHSVTLRQASNSFAGVSPGLAWLHYARSSVGVTIYGRTEQRMFLRRDGKLTGQRGEVSIALEHGDEIRWSDFVILVSSPDRGSTPGK